MRSSGAKATIDTQSRHSNKLDEYFEITARGSSLPTEIIAGCSVFLALSYIIVVNPAILSQGGFDKSAVFFATVLLSGLATLAMGLWARLPFVVAPGMEMNAFVAFFAIGTLGFTWQEALGMVFWSGVLMVALTLLKVRETIIDAIPAGMRVGLATSVGVFLVLIALSISGLLQYQGLVLRGFGTPLTPMTLALAIGLLSTLVLHALRVPGSVLIAIILTSFACLNLLGIKPEDSIAVTQPHSLTSAVGALDLTVILNPRSLSVVLVLFVLDFYGSIAKFIGLSMATSIAPDGVVPRRWQALLVDGAGTVGGSLVGTTSLIAYVESAVGIRLGGRTGISAIVCGLLMLSSFAFLPLLQFIPVAATTGTLVFVGYQLLPKRQVWSMLGGFDKIVIVVMSAAVVATFAIDKAMLLAFLMYVGRQVIRRHVNGALIASAVLLGVATALQIR